MAKVKIVEVCKVAPPPTNAASNLENSVSPKLLPLSFFDLLWLRFPPVQRIFFYEIPTLDDPNTDSTQFFHSDILPRLKHSLSLTLQHFLPLAGNLIWPESSYKPVFLYVEGDDAVSLTLAETDADFDLLSGTNEFFEATRYHPLIPNLAVPHERAALLALQVTLFPNSGFSIGMTIHHTAVDGKSVHMFMKSWAHICRSQGNHNYNSLELKPSFDRTVIIDSAGIDALYVEQFRELDGGPNNKSLMTWKPNQVPADAVRGTFRMTHENINTLRQLVKVHMTNNHDQMCHLSTFCLTCGYILVCLTKSEELYKDDNKIKFVFAVDARSRLEPPVPETYFGNCLGGRLVHTNAKDLAGEDGLAVAAKAISDAIKSLETKASVLDRVEMWVLSFIKSRSPQSAEAGGREREFSTAGSPRFEAYNTDFGWGRPKKTDVVSIDRTTAMSLSETRNGDGIEVGLVLKKHHMEIFAFLFHQGLQL